MLLIDQNTKLSKNTTYSTKQRIDAVVMYRLCGNLSMVSRNMKIPRDTLADWKNTDWWKEIDTELKAENRAKLQENLKSVVDKAFTAVEDRLVNGDSIFDQKSGMMRKKPIGAHTANQILKDSLDKTLAIEKLGRDEKIVENQETIVERLAKLSEEFIKFTKSKTIEGEVLGNGRVDDAVHDERPQGLREGEPTLQIEAGTGQEERTTESSASPHA